MLYLRKFQLDSISISNVIKKTERGGGLNLPNIFRDLGLTQTLINKVRFFVIKVASNY